MGNLPNDFGRAYSLNLKTGPDLPNQYFSF